MTRTLALLVALALPATFPAVANALDLLWLYHGANPASAP